MFFPQFIAPVRKPVNRSGSHIIGKFPSLKLGRTVLFESTIERDLIHFLDYECSVSSFTEQPYTIEYITGGKTRRYTPDFQAIIRGRDRVLECKPEDQVHDPENEVKFKAARTDCDERGWEFRVVTDREIRSGFRLRNIKLLRRYALCLVSPQVKGTILGALNGFRGSSTVMDLAETPGLSGIDIRAAILHMAFHHELSVPLNDAPVVGGTSVFLPDLFSEEGLL